jgi:SAM-dependent methyltransferase
MAVQDGSNHWDAYFRRAGRSALASRAPQSDEAYFGHGHHTLVELMQFVGAPPPTRALEIGCGDGRITKTLVSLSRSVTAMDIAPTVLDACRLNLAEADNVDFVLGGADQLGAYPDDYFDFIMSTNVFQHVPSQDTVRKYISESSRLLHRGGIAVLQMRDPGLRTRLRDAAVDVIRLPTRLPSFDRYWRGCRIGEDDACAAAARPGRVIQWHRDPPLGWLVIRHCEPRDHGHS